MDRKEISRRILDFTLEIISLLSGEDYTIVKKKPGGIPLINEPEELSITLFMDPPPLIHEQKILELTHKMMELLTGEVPKRCKDVAVSVSMEDWEYIEGHKDLYKEAMMEAPRPLTSPGSDSRRRNPPERCPRPLYSQDCPEEKLPENHQMTNQGEDLTDIKMEDEEERMMGDPPCKSEVEEDIPGDVTTENPSKKSEGNVMLSPDVKVEDILQRSSRENPITCDVHPGLHSTDLSYKQPNNEEPSSDRSQIVTTSPDLSCNPPNLGEPSPDQSQIVTTSPDLSHNPPNEKEPTSDQSQIVTTSTGQKGGKSFQCEECGKQFTKSSNLSVHKRIHTGEKSSSRSERGICFTQMSNLVTREKINTGEKSYPSSERGKCFTQMSNLVTREKIHTGENPYPCSECGKGFFSKSNLLVHQRSHTGAKPITCSESVKCVTQMSNLVPHEKIHTGVKPLICSECGKGFFSKTNLMFHQKIHRR